MDAKTLESELKNYRIREGVIYKRSKFLQEWRERWMVLTMNYILIYTNKSLSQLTDALDLREIKSYKSYVRKDEEMIPAGFKIRTQEEMYYFCSRNCNEKWSWLVSFERVMDFKYAGVSAYNSIEYIKTRGFMSQAEFEAGKFDIPSIFPQTQQVAPKQISQEKKYQAEIERIKKQMERQMNELKLKEQLLKKKEKEQEKLLRDKELEQEQLLKQKELQQEQLLRQKQIEREQLLRQKEIEREQQLKLLEKEREESLRIKEEQLRLVEKEKENLLTQKMKERQLLIQQIEEEKLLQLSEKEKEKQELIKQREKNQQSKYLEELQRLKKQLKKKESEKVTVQAKVEEKSKVEKVQISQISVGKVAELRKLYESKISESSKPTQSKVYVASQKQEKQEDSSTKPQPEKPNIAEPILQKVVSQPQKVITKSSVETKIEVKSEVKEKIKVEVKEQPKIQVKAKTLQIKVEKSLTRQQFLNLSRKKVLEGLFDQFSHTAFDYKGLPYIIDFLMKMTAQKNLGYKEIFSGWAKTHENRFNFSQTVIKIIKDFNDYKNSNLLSSFIELLFGEAAGLFRGIHLSLVQKKLIQILMQVRDDERLLQGVLKAMCVMKKVRIFERDSTVRQLLLGLSLGPKESLVGFSSVLLVDF